MSAVINRQNVSKLALNCHIVPAFFPLIPLMNSLGNLLIREFRLQPGCEWTSDAACWWFLQVFSGEGYWLAAPKARSLHVGEVLVISPLVRPLIRASQLSEVVVKGFPFAPEDILGFFTLAERQFIERKLAAKSEPVQFLPSTHPVARRLDALVPVDPAGGTFVERAEALGIVAAAFDSTPLPHHAPTILRGSSLQRFRQLIAELPELELLNYTNAQLALMCGCSSRYFNLLFWQHFRISARDYRVKLRLLKACQFLRASDSNVTSIAKECGFQTAKGFGQLFRTRFGASPSEWRDNERSSESAAVLRRAAQTEGELGLKAGSEAAGCHMVVTKSPQARH
jgi:AraC-like DNA-binding protein